MDRSIYKYILRHSLRHQIVLTALAVGSFPFLYLFYELPKMIVNGAIQGRKLTFPVEHFGFRFDQLDYLFLLCGLFLALVLINQAFKYVINVYRGLTGERLLRRLRYELITRILRFPLPVFRKKSQGELIAMVTAEVEPLGGFVGDSFSVPAFQGGTMVVILGFLLVQNPLMAIAAVAFYPVQFYIIPKLQRRVNLLGKERVRLVRHLSQRVGETVAGVAEVHAHNTAALELARFSHQLGDLFHVRYQIYLWKFVIKFANNTINQLGPFAFYSIGGYLVIAGSLELGTLVAAIAAQKDLAAPWKELLTYYQQREDARIKYEQVVEQFEPPGLLAESLLLDEPETVPPIAGDIISSNLGLVDDTGNALVEGASFRFAANSHVALVGAGGSGKQELAQLVARLVMPSTGSVMVNGARLADLPEAVTGRRIAYVGAHPYIFSASAGDNLVYGLKHRPLADADGPQIDRQPAADKLRKWRKREAEASGNSTDDIGADWVDYAAAGVADGAALTRRVLEVLALVEMDTDIFELGLRSTIDPAAKPDVADTIVEARAALRQRLRDPSMAALVETYDETRYNANATVGENLMFGTPVGEAFATDRLAENPYVAEVLEAAGLTEDFLEAGRQVASTTIELFADLPPGHAFFQQFSFIDSADLPDYQAVLNRTGRDGIESLSHEDRTMLMALPFRLIPARHRLGIIDEAWQSRIIAARRIFKQRLPVALAGAIEFFDDSRYNAAASVQDNILFGKTAYGQAGGVERVRALVVEVIETLTLRRAVMEAGLDFQVGIGGSRLSAAQRQKLAIARAVLKRPDLLILDEATSALDATTQARVMDTLLNEFKGRGVVWALHQAALAARFDEVVVMRGGTVVQQGRFDQLNTPGSALDELLGSH